MQAPLESLARMHDNVGTQTLKNAHFTGEITGVLKVI
jgi:hypothetical protein